MRITIDDSLPQNQPTVVSWERPRQLGYTGVGVPVFGAYWSCSLGFDRLTVVEFHRWFDASTDGIAHDILLPHPESGLMVEYSCYVSQFSPRLNTRDWCRAAAAGVDILITRVNVQ